MGLCTRHRIWLILIALLKWHDHVLGLWFVKEPISHLPDEVDHALAVCQGSNMILNCRNRYNKIVVKNTFYGRKNNHTCASKIFDTEKLCDQPTPDLIKQKVDLMCTGEYKCKLPVTPAFLEKKGSNMCPSSRKYLQVTYACHQDPKLHMVCYNNCTNKCWPLCQKECCEPKPKPPKHEVHEPAPAVEKTNEKSIQELTQAPQELTCHGNCPNRCAPQCDVTCCETKPAKIEPLKDTKSTHAVINTCIGDCQNICAPLCRPSCCSRHKKSTAKSHTLHSPRKVVNYNQSPHPHPGPISKPLVTSCPVDCHGHCLPKCPPVCCAQIPKDQYPHYVEPLTARMQTQPQCPNGCNERCAPSCSQQCCQYMMNNSPNRYEIQPVQPYANLRAQAQTAQAAQTPNRSPQAPQAPQARAGYFAPQQPISQVFSSVIAQPAQPAQTYAQYNAPQQVQPQSQAGYTTQAVARDAYQPPLVTSQTLEVEVPNMQYNRDNPAQTYERIYPQQVPLGCPQSCARSCDSSCKLGCCASPYFFTTNSISDDEQRRSYELLLAKYRNNQLQKYYQNTRAFG